MYDWLNDAMADGGVVVTATRRLARVLRKSFNDTQIAHGRDTWATPDIRSWQSWLASMLDSDRDATTSPRRIDQHSATALWESSVRTHAGTDVLSFGGLVEQSMQAWQRIHEWQIPVGELRRFAETRDQEKFAIFAEAYLETLRSNSWIDSAGLPKRLADAVSAGTIKPPRKLTIAGFGQLTPAADALLQRLRDGGCAVSVASRPDFEPAVASSSHVDSASEMRAAGRWARTLLLANPTLRLAVVSGGLDVDAGDIARELREGLVPGWQYGGPAYQTAVTVSYGQKLSAYPLVAIALLAIRWGVDGLGSREISVLLRSDCLAGPVAPSRTRLEMALRRLPDRIWMPGDLQRALGRSEDPGTQSWWECVRSIGGLSALSQQRRAPSEWAARFDAVLNEAGWPGRSQPDSTEFQVINRWRELLNEVARTALVQPRMTLRDALWRLTQIAGTAVYQPDTGPGVLSLLGPLEASGMEFDGLWISGMDSSRWPLPSRPSALVARSVQRRYGMPHASPAHTLAYSRRILRGLAESTAELALSWSRTENDSDLIVSPLVRDFESRHGMDIDHGRHASSLANSCAMEELRFDAVPRVARDEKVGGGAYTVQRQFVDPFSAFAAGRLNIPELTAFESGLSARLRGSIVHDALHHLYRECPNLTEIRSWSPEQRLERIRRACEAAIEPHARSGDPTHRRLFDFERRRTQSLLEAFLQLERQRDDFAVSSVEHSLEFERHGVRLKLRVDRLDRLADGTLFVVDYKTGAARPLLTRDGNPADLQLVVYACALNDSVGGIGLISVDSREIRYTAAGASVQWDDTDASTWTFRLRSWQQHVDSAIEQLAAGDARVNLQLPPRECRTFALLSRVEEIRRAR